MIGPAAQTAIIYIRLDQLITPSRTFDFSESVKDFKVLQVM